VVDSEQMCISFWLSLRILSPGHVHYRLSLQRLTFNFLRKAGIIVNFCEHPVYKYEIWKCWERTHRKFTSVDDAQTLLYRQRILGYLTNKVTFRLRTMTPNEFSKYVSCGMVWGHCFIYDNCHLSTEPVWCLSMATKCRFAFWDLSIFFEYRLDSCFWAFPIQAPYPKSWTLPPPPCLDGKCV
jgi:hypothetical protein